MQAQHFNHLNIGPNQIERYWTKKKIFKQTFPRDEISHIDIQIKQRHLFLSCKMKLILNTKRFPRYINLTHILDRSQFFEFMEEFRKYSKEYYPYIMVSESEDYLADI